MKKITTKKKLLFWLFNLVNNNKTYPATQCAAVKIQYSSRIVPPQKWLLDCNEIWYGHSPANAFSPPTIVAFGDAGRIGLANVLMANNKTIKIL